MAKYDQIMKILAILGGIIALIDALLSFFGSSFSSGYWGHQFSIPFAIIAIILAILVILSVVQPGKPLPFTGIVLLIMGILIIIFGSWIGGVLVIIAGILGFLN